MTEKAKEILEKQLELLSEVSKSTNDPQSLAELSRTMVMICRHI